MQGESCNESGGNVTVVINPRDRLELRRVVDAVALDRAAQLRVDLRNQRHVTIDLSQAQFIDHDALLLMGGMTAYRKRRGMSTLFNLPWSDSVMDFLRTWAFPDFMQAVCAPSPAFTEESEMALQESSHRLPKYVSFQMEGNERRAVLLRESLQITPITITGDAWADAGLATSRFLNENFRAVMNRSLGDRGDSNVANIVHEAALNAATHPGARLAFTSCHVRKRQPDDPVEGRSYELQLAIWDDGASLAGTLGAALDRGAAITADRFGEEGATFDLVIQRDHEGVELLSFDDSEPPVSRDSTVLSSAAFMLGVTSDPSRSRQAATTFPNAAPSVRQSGGVGLALLRTRTIDAFGGRVIYRSGDLRLEISAGAQENHYTFHINVVPDDGWPIEGNLLLVDIPLGGRAK